VDPTPDESLYDEYLDLLVQGRAEDPDTFLQGRGAVSEAVRAHLHAIRRTLGAAPDAAIGDPEDDLPFERLGEFRLIRRLAAGGMGVIYLAEQESLARPVALKVLRPEYGGLHPAAARFEREVRAVARLRHPNIVAVHATGFDQGVRYLAMEYVRGRGLDQILAEARAERRPLRVARVLRWLADVARALAYAHEQGVIHRDVKPSNILITGADEGRDDAEGRALLLDFGLARDLDANQATLTDSFVGTPHYVAPEQIARRGEAVDRRTDVYGLGCTLYYGLTFRRPFDGDSLERIFHHILTVDPPPVRKLNPSLPRDVEVVTSKAMEKDPARRYPSAAALAHDLEALLEFRPIAARKPGPLPRLVKWARRNPAPAATVITGVLALLALVTLLVIQRETARAERRRQAHDTLSRARVRIAEMRAAHESSRALEVRIKKLESERMNRYFTHAEDRQVDVGESEIAELERRREHGFYEVLDLLRAAERLGAADSEVRAVRAELYLLRYLESVALEDTSSQRLYRNLVRENDPDDRLAEALTGRGSYAFLSDPPGVEVHFFRFYEQSELVPDGERRLVPVPIAGPTPVPPGTFALRVARDHGRFIPGDLLLEVAGRPIRGTVFVSEGHGDIHRLDRLVRVDGEPVLDVREARTLGATGNRFEFERDGATRTVEAGGLAALGIEIEDPRRIAEAGGVSAVTWRDGRRREEILPAGLDLVITSIPLFVGEGSRVGTTPTGAIPLEQGPYLVLARGPGFEDLRATIECPRGASGTLRLPLCPRGTTPDGYHRIVELGVQPRAFWIMDREVTMEEYCAFLDEPAIRAEIDASAKPIYFPRNSNNERKGGHLPRDETGRFQVPEKFRGWPVLGVSWHDAVAYARWRTERARAAGRPYTFRLPTFREWTLAAGDDQKRNFVFGNHFRPKWVSCCFARRKPRPEPGLGFPIDESPRGPRDMAGSVSEWLDAWLNEEAGYRRFASGSWADGGPENIFHIYGGNGLPPDGATDMVGFRLALDIEPANASSASGER